MRKSEGYLMDFLFTLWTFGVVLFTLPCFVLSYTVLHFFHNIWIGTVSFLYPELEFIKTTTLRTLVETHRNQGVVTILLKVRGPPKLSTIRRHLEELVRRKNKSGKLAFPHLTDSLVTRCGTYAWRKHHFDIEQNLIFAPYNFRGRPVNDFNIQDHVSDIVSKFLQNGIPAWQLVIIPSSENHHHLLLRLHHILLSEGLNIADMLPLIPPVRSNIINQDCKTNLSNVLKLPKHIPALKNRLAQDTMNSWSEFISNNDPLERPELCKRNVSFQEFAAISFIVFVSTFRECRKGFKALNPDLITKIRYAMVTFKRERKKRRMNLANFIKSFFVSCNPTNVLANMGANFYKLTRFAFKMPLRVCNEIKAIQTCFTLDYCGYPNTIVGFLFNYVPLTYKAFTEFCHYCTIILNTPRYVWEELSCKSAKIETVTLCGRKVVAWSHPVSVEVIRKIARTTATTDTEVILAAASVALSRFITKTNHVQPDQVPITARNINSNYFLLTGSNVKSTDAVGGMLYFNLPILDSNKDVDLLENLKYIKDNTSLARESQQLTFLLSILQTKYGFLSKLLPTTLITVALKYLSLKYAVSFTEVSNKQPSVMQRTTWGQEVISVIYWRPPQANISMSLCANYYGENVIFGVMCDAQLAPNHHLLVKGFHEHIQDLQTSVMIQ